MCRYIKRIDEEGATPCGVRSWLLESCLISNLRLAVTADACLDGSLRPTPALTEWKLVSRLEGQVVLEGVASRAAGRGLDVHPDLDGGDLANGGAAPRVGLGVCDAWRVVSLLGFVHGAILPLGLTPLLRQPDALVSRRAHAHDARHKIVQRLQIMLAERAVDLDVPVDPAEDKPRANGKDGGRSG